nr:LacI family DNA-binding transcriptional regulator [Ancylobacter crimeensis]
MVAERAGVSLATVSNVLNGKPSVSPDYAARVMEAVEALGYVPDLAASRLRSGKAALAGVVVPDLGNPMFARFVSVLEHVAREDGFDLVVVSSRNDPAEEADRLANIRAWRPSGVIVLPCDGALAARLPAGWTAPIVVADRIPDDGRFDLVAVDNGPAAAQVTRHLAGAGCRTCLVVATSLAISNMRERWEGAQVGAGAMELALAEVGDDPASGVARLSGRLSGTGRPDALFALEQMTSLALYPLLGSLGLVVPADIAYASFDEMEWMRLVTPPLTAARQPVEAMAQAAWTRLRARMAGDAGPPATIRLACTVTLRGSTPPAASPGPALTPSGSGRHRP